MEGRKTEKWSISRGREKGPHLGSPVVCGLRRGAGTFGGIRSGVSPIEPSVIPSIAAPQSSSAPRYSQDHSVPGQAQCLEAGGPAVVEAADTPEAHSPTDPGRRHLLGLQAALKRPSSTLREASDFGPPQAPAPPIQEDLFRV
ncbi:hypothetical protein, unlikely [Trypanosoma congolense IL3000]|uniref:Uncharacterized protein n=1 Tax=Trypanosoma congolense (strain IL3000) TaxID=1068625 RepID=F9W811_TRYCI|nr:hypothetical protein, unlikely [Trypanosoma congolense IL3000]CCD13335.1 hypothetical protein, unlikely [Trypanosoma congolense IL3000]